MMFDPDGKSSYQNINQFLVYSKIKFQISYLTIILNYMKPT